MRTQLAGTYGGWVSIRLGYQIPNFSYGTPVSELFPTVVAQAQEAERAGFDTVLVMDHFYQLPGIGSPDQPMLESYTTLAGLARETSTIQLSALVTGNTYRNPTHLAKSRDSIDRRRSSGIADRSTPERRPWSSMSASTPRSSGSITTLAR